ncbi:MAG: aminodeoxychorismate synthase component I [Bacillota bacterium]
MQYYCLPETAYGMLSSKGAVLLETVKCDGENRLSYLFFKPLEILEVFQTKELPVFFLRLQDYLNQGCFAAGYLAYEAGYGFEEIMKAYEPPNPTHPAAWFGIYEKPFIFDHLKGEWEDCRKPEQFLSMTGGGNTGRGTDCRIKNIRFELAGELLSREGYRAKIAKIKEYIGSGDVYQINLTGKCRFEFGGSVYSLYDFLKNRQKVPYAAFLHTDHGTVLSFSPELFFRMGDGGVIRTKPMKGTAQRGRTGTEDEEMGNRLRHDEKNRAENVMIVDLLRNDLGRIAGTGSVKVPELFKVEKYETLWQMTSTVEGVLPENADYYGIFRALFPCGSVTGAPKIRAMQIIKELEKTPRGVYTGAIGFFSPNREAVFNVAIRTIALRGRKGEMGVGSGIVWDSGADEEYDEGLLKAHFLTGRAEKFDLIETVLWDGAYRFLPEHLARLEDSAAYFGYTLNPDCFAAKMKENSLVLAPDLKYKVRVLLDFQGRITITNKEIAPVKKRSPGLVRFAGDKTDSRDRFLYHKTTHRRLYDLYAEKALQNGYDDYLFLNERNQVTEGAISNIFIKKGGCLLTPPLECGLLNGVFRRHVLISAPRAAEKILYAEDLRSADAIYICNSVRGMRKVMLVEE